MRLFTAISPAGSGLCSLFLRGHTEVRCSQLTVGDLQGLPLNFPASCDLTKPDWLRAVIDSPGSLVFDQIHMATDEVKEEILRLIHEDEFHQDAVIVLVRSYGGDRIPMNLVEIRYPEELQMHHLSKLEF